MAARAMMLNSRLDVPPRLLTTNATESPGKRRNDDHKYNAIIKILIILIHQIYNNFK